jgi:ribonuclease HI
VTELNGHDDSTTTHRMELMGAIEGLRATERGADVVLRSDSQYVVKSMTLHYKRNKNHDLWELLDAETKARRVQFEWVRGHGVDPINNRADELALMGANGQFIAEGASNPKRNLSKAELLNEIATRLKRGESIRECKACGAKFLTSIDDDYCSQIRCQLEARTRQ